MRSDTLKGHMKVHEKYKSKTNKEKFKELLMDLMDSVLEKTSEQTNINEELSEERHGSKRAFDDSSHNSPELYSINVGALRKSVASTFWQPWNNIVDSEPSKKKRKDTEGEPEGEPEHDIEQKIEPEPEKRKVKCPHCSLFLSSRGSLYNHITVKHSHERRWICDQCGQGFARKDYLQKHLAKHAPKQVWICDHCGQGFIGKDYFRRHLAKHAPKHLQSKMDL
jgi:ribosomal protein L37AE/L43A